MVNAGGTMGSETRLLRAVNDILFDEWDPIGINEYFKCRDEYASYAPTILRILLSGGDEHKLTTHLCELQRVSMGLSKIDEEVNRRIARLLLGLVSR